MLIIARIIYFCSISSKFRYKQYPMIVIQYNTQELSWPEGEQAFVLMDNQVFSFTVPNYRHLLVKRGGELVPFMHETAQPRPP